MFQATTATSKIINLTKRLRCIQGGTSASKTISVLMWIIHYLQTNENKLFSVVSESFPHLKRGAIRDFLNIMQSQGYFNDQSWNKSDYIYTFHTGSKIEFFSADLASRSSKTRGPRRNGLFINEANNVSYETYTQLATRTTEVILLDWNPVSEFWYYTEIKDKIDHDFITLTYQDNEALHPAIVQEIESRKSNKNWWKVYGLGQLGEVEGRVYTDWQIIDSIPHEARLERYGLDFGYADPTALIAIYYHNGGYILDEVCYQKGLLNDQLADLIKNQEHKALVVADCADPRSIDELKLHGINIVGVNSVNVEKTGKPQIEHGIQFVQQKRISVTKRSVNLIKEYRNYLLDQDVNGNFISGKYVGADHALDAVRYGFESLRPMKIEASKEEAPNPWTDIW